MRFTDYSSHFQALVKILKYLGAWVDYGNSTSKYYFLYCILINMTFIFCGNLSITIFWIKNSTSIKSFAATGYLVPVANMVAVKSYYLYKNKATFKKLITSLDLDIFKPQNSEELSIVSKMLKKWRTIKTVLILTLSAPITCALVPFFYPKDGGYPVQAWFPIDIDFPLRYQIIYIYQSIYLMLNASISIFIDITVVGICLFLSLLCDLLCKRLEEIGNRPNLKENREQFVHSVDLHNSILEFLNTTEKVFGKIYFFQIIGSTIAMCMDLFLLSLNSPSFESFFLATYLFTVGGLLLVPCWFASDMTRKSENIPNAAYCSNWTDTTNSFKRDITIFIARSQRPLKLCAANYFEISVETFVKIARASFSYYAALQNLNVADSEQYNET